MSTTIFNSIPKSNLFDILVFGDNQDKTSFKDKNLYKIALQHFKHANRMIWAQNPSFKDVFRIEENENNTSSKKIFMRLVNRLHDKAKNLGCNITAPENLSQEDRLDWEWNHYQKLMEKISFAENPVDQIPAEALQAIFSHLSLSDALKVTQVSSWWKSNELMLVSTKLSKYFSSAVQLTAGFLYANNKIEAYKKCIELFSTANWFSDAKSLLDLKDKFYHLRETLITYLTELKADRDDIECMNHTWNVVDAKYPGILNQFFKDMIALVPYYKEFDKYKNGLVSNFDLESKDETYMVILLGLANLDDFLKALEVADNISNDKPDMKLAAFHYISMAILETHSLMNAMKKAKETESGQKDLVHYQKVQNILNGNFNNYYTLLDNALKEANQINDQDLKLHAQSKISMALSNFPKKVLSMVKSMPDGNLKWLTLFHIAMVQGLNPDTDMEPSDLIILMTDVKTKYIALKLFANHGVEVDEARIMTQINKLSETVIQPTFDAEKLQRKARKLNFLLA